MLRPWRSRIWSSFFDNRLCVEQTRASTLLDERVLLAMAASAADGVEACFDMVRAAHRSPVAALVAAATDMTRYLDTPEGVANSLAFLQMDLSGSRLSPADGDQLPENARGVSQAAS